MSFARRIVRGAAWTVSASLGSRIVGLLGTLAVTRFIAPDEYGEVTVAAVIVMTMQQVSTLGVGQYLIAKPDAGYRAAFHATVLTMGAGLVTLVAVLAFGDPISELVGARGASVFIPGLVVAALLDRVSFLPERILVRDLRFSVLGATRTVGDVVYSVGTVALAAAGWGATAIVLGNVLRSVVRAAAFVAVTNRVDWLKPCRLTWRESIELLRFGLPLSFASISHMATRRWDNLFVAKFFGPGPAGAYNLAYNLADVPAIQIGEQVGDVLFPSFARMKSEQRKEALVRSLSLLGLVVFPLAVGLGAVADTLVRLLFDPRWHIVTPMLVVLSVLSVTRPVGWTIAAFLQAQARPRVVMLLEVLKLVVLAAAVFTIGRPSALATCFAVGVGFAVHTAACLWVVHRTEGVALRSLFSSVLVPLSACLPLAAAVLVGRYWCTALVGPSLPGLTLGVEVVFGIAGYALGAALMARDPSRDLLARLRDALPARAQASKSP